MKNFIALSALVVAITGCAGFLPPKHDEALDRSAECCRDMKSLPFRNLEDGQKIRTLVGPNTPAFSFPEGKSFFLAVRLGKTGKRNLIVRTYPQNMLNNMDGHVFVPRVTFLSSQYAVLATVTPEFTVQRPALGIGESSWRADMTVPSDADFAVVHTSVQDRMKVMGMRDRDQRGGYLYTRTGPAGEIEVELQ